MNSVRAERFDEADLFESNLRSLRKRYPEYADVLSIIRPEGQFVFEESVAGPICRDGSGAWLHGPGDPWAAARHDAASLVGEQAELFIVVSPGLGYQPLAILEELANRAPGSILLVVEHRLELLKAAFGLMDWAPLLHSTSTVLLLGDPQVVVEAFLKRHPAVALLPMNLVVPQERAQDPGVATMGDRLIAFAAQTQQVMEGQLQTTGLLIGQRRARREPLRVLLAVPDSGYLAGPIAEGFKACGCGVDIQTEQSATLRGVRAHDWLQEISRFAPDVVLWMNRPELSKLASGALRSLGIANVHWSLDSPRRMRLTRSELSTVDVHLSFDAHYLPMYADYGAGKASQLSLGAGIQPLPGCGPGDQLWPRRLGPDVSFVGSLGESRVVELRQKLLRMDPDLLGLLDELAAADGDPAPRFEAATGSGYEGAPCLYVDEVRATRRRLEVLSQIPPSRLRVFGGTEWASSKTGLAKSYAGRAVAYGLDLSSLYYHSHINLNVFHEQCVDSTNSRVYDVLAAGGFLLTEHRPCLEREFEVGRHLATFSTADEAAEKVAYYLAHPSEREELARQGQRHVLTHHTFARRCRRVLELVASVRREAGDKPG